MRTIIHRCEVDPNSQTSVDFHDSKTVDKSTLSIRSFVIGVQSMHFSLDLKPEDAAAFRLLADLIDADYRAQEGQGHRRCLRGDSDA